LTVVVGHKHGKRINSTCTVLTKAELHAIIH
jgi:hypothetical protein